MPSNSLTNTIHSNLKISHLLLLLTLAIVSTIFIEHSALDVAFSHLFYQNGQWLIEKNMQPFRFIFYDLPKTLIILLGIYLLINLIVKKWFQSKISHLSSAQLVNLQPVTTHFPKPRLLRGLLPLNNKELGFLLLTLIVVPSVIASLKAITHVSCPNHLLLFDGELPYLSLWQDILSNNSAKCFPAAHASAGFALYAFAYLPRYTQHKFKIILFVTLLAWTMGLYKIMIGDHFFSHTLVSMWLSWAVVYFIALMFFRRQN